MTAKIGLRHLPARAGATYSVPSAFLMFVLIAPVTIDFAAFDWRAAVGYSLIGLLFPAAVTLLTFFSTDRIGPAMTGAISGTSPLFAIPAAVLVLDEAVPARAVVASIGVAIGIALLSWQVRRDGIDWRQLWMPVAASAVRGSAQVAVKAVMALWPSAFAAALFGYGVSSFVLIASDSGGRRRRGPPPRIGIAWFVATGLFNGGGLVLLYWAIAHAPVSVVAPIVATIPLIAVLFGWIVFRDRRFSARELAGILLSVAAIAYLVTG